MADDKKWYESVPVVGGILGGLDLIGDAANFGLGMKQYNYQKQLNDTLMSREDSAWQRAVADAEKAGISKAQLGSGASAQQLNPGSMPSIQTDLQQRKINAMSMETMATELNNAKTTGNILQSQLEDMIANSPYLHAIHMDGKEYADQLFQNFNQSKMNNQIRSWENDRRFWDNAVSQYAAEKAINDEIAKNPWWYMYGSDLTNGVIKNLTPNLNFGVSGGFKFKK